MSTVSTDDNYTTLAAQLGFSESKRFRAILEYLMTPDQARMAAALPGTAADLADKTGFDEGQVAEALDALFFKGVVFPKGDFNQREYYRFARSVGQLHDATQATQELDIDDDEDFYRLWHDFVMNEWYPVLGKYQAALPKPPSRIVPSYKALKGIPESEILPCEDFRELLKAQELIAVVPCACRYRTSSVDEHCEHAEEEERWNCLQFGRAAEYVVVRGSGKKLSVDEALELLDEIEEDALLHIWPNHTSMTGVHTSCQCCRDCCMNFVPMDMLNESIGKVWEKARFEAVIDQDKCEGCQKCGERCHFDAIEMVKPQTAEQKKKSRKLRSKVIPDKCWGCGVCVVGCKEYQAITLKVVRPVEHIPAPA